MAAMPSNYLFWAGFLFFVVLMMALDLGVFQRTKHTISFREAMTWTVVWISLAGLFSLLLYHHGQRMAADSVLSNRQLSLQFITGYVIELSLSVDNLFVFLLLFRMFNVPGELQRKVLTWGIVGALIMRAVFIFAGVALIRKFAWIEYVFGVFLIYVGVKLLFESGDNAPHENAIVKLFRKVFPVTPDFDGEKFFTVRNGVRYATPLAVVLLMVETTDVIFAVDSIPAVLAISRDAFIVFTSNVFAILGLRSMYFALAGLMDLFHLLHYGLSVVLIFIGVKMLGAHYFEIPIAISLGVVIGVLLVTVALSLVVPKKKHA
ncbi:Integral membrane protein TerC [Candidatus Koribacter versatilis Ellin345]|uniref:Integral membrane protein TerC n=2 Tax=Candidatus Korobacter versatilis TaxID=658062 RepID=Q1IN82_KORVE|nr:Integral membrane protein TerC [Candidatus Koribacter versatilis Ellin345]